MAYGPDAQGIYHPLAPSVEHLPDHLDMYSFIFDYFPASRPDIRGTGIPLLIDEETGVSYTFEQIRERTDALSVGLYHRAGVSEYAGGRDAGCHC